MHVENNVQAILHGPLNVSAYRVRYEKSKIPGFGSKTAQEIGSLKTLNPSRASLAYSASVCWVMYEELN